METIWTIAEEIPTEIIGKIWEQISEGIHGELFREISDRTSGYIFEECYKNSSQISLKTPARILEGTNLKAKFLEQSQDKWLKNPEEFLKIFLTIFF